MCSISCAGLRSLQAARAIFSTHRDRPRLPAYPLPMTIPSNPGRKFRRVAILFAGGPAPAANAVISTCAASFVRHGIEVFGIKHGYSALAEYSPDKPLEAGRDYMELNPSTLRRTRNSQGILIGTARTNPGRNVSSPAHLDDPERTA